MSSIAVLIDEGRLLGVEKRDLQDRVGSAANLREPRHDAVDLSVEQACHTADDWVRHAAHESTGTCSRYRESLCWLLNRPRRICLQVRSKWLRIGAGDALALTAEHALLAHSDGVTLDRLREFKPTALAR